MSNVAIHTLVFLNPGHFHAALTLRQPHPRVAGEVFVYAEAGQELDDFLALVREFNTRREHPTAWTCQVIRGGDPLARLIAERRGEAVVLAGRNDTKMHAIARLHEAGFAVLADKPWVTGAAALPLLEAATDGKDPLLMDIMPSRYEATSALLKLLVGVPGVFGTFEAQEDDAPAIELESVHHLCKTVNGRPLVRPAWYFDVNVQGDGIVDVPSHLADLAQWWIGGAPFDYRRDVALRSARRWNTAVPGDIFTRITGCEAFPPVLTPWVRDGVLEYPCNGEVCYTLRGHPVRIRSEWHLEPPEKEGGDTARAVLRGSRATLLVEQGAHTAWEARLFVRPVPDASGVSEALRASLAAWDAEFPGLATAEAEQGWEVLIPPALRIGHEAQFALVLEDFLDGLEQGRRRRDLPANLRTKYALLAHAQGMAQAPT